VVQFFVPDDQLSTRRVLVPRECNLSEYLATTLSKSKQRSLVFERDIAVGTDIVHQHWQIEAGAYGLPQPFDQDVAFAIWWFFQKQGAPDSGDISCTEAAFLDVLRCPKGGSQYRKLDIALKRLQTSTIVSHQAILDIQSGVHLTDRFNFLIRYGKDNREETRTREICIHLSIHKFFVASYKAGYIHLLDYDKYFSLTRPLAKRLYCLIDKMMGAKSTFEIGFERVVEMMPMAERKRSRMLQSFQPAFEQLVAAECFSNIQVVPGKTVETKVVFKRTAKEKAELLVPRPEEVCQEIDLKRVPIFLGVNQVFLATMVRKYGAEQVQRVLEDLDGYYAKSDRPITSHEGLISRALEGPTRLEGPAPQSGAAILPSPAKAASTGTDDLGEIVRRFYCEIGVGRMSDGRVREGVQVLERIQQEAGVDVPTLNRMVDWVLQHREKKFPGLHSIKVLAKAWDQALSSIERSVDQKNAAERESKAAEEREERRKKETADRLAAERAALTDQERAALRREAEETAAKNPFLAAHLERIEDEGEREAWLESHIQLAEGEILLERRPRQPTSSPVRTG
jgi:hypothetical protein